MNELNLQDRFLLPFFRQVLGYREVKANTITNSLIIEEDLQEFISQTELNKKPYETLLKKYRGDNDKLLHELIEMIQERSSSSRNMALFILQFADNFFHGICVDMTRKNSTMNGLKDKPKLIFCNTN